MTAEQIRIMEILPNLVDARRVRRVGINDQLPSTKGLAFLSSNRNISSANIGYGGTPGGTVALLLASGLLVFAFAFAIVLSFRAVDDPKLVLLRVLLSSAAEEATDSHQQNAA